MSFVTELLGALVFVGLIIYWYYVNSEKWKFYKKFISPPGLLILGNALELASTKTMLDVLMKYQNYDGIVKIDLGPIRKIFLVTDYNLIEFILSSTKAINKSIEYKYLKPWLGTGLLTSEGAKWKKFRRILTPAFHFKILEEFIDIFERTSEIFVEKIHEKLGNSVDIYPMVTLCTLDIICETAMGTTVNAQQDTDSTYVQSVKELSRILMERSVHILEMYDWSYSFTENFKTEQKALSELHGYSNSVITKRKGERKDKLQKLIDDIGIRKKKAFLDLLLDATVDGRALTQEEIRQEVDTFMFEGHDTTSSGISFTLFSIANHPEVQRKIIEEQKQIFGDIRHCTVKYQDLMEMKYLENVIKEALRLYPSVPLFARTTDQELDCNGLKIPKGITFSIFAFGIQRNPKYFRDPEKFQPERFDTIDGTKPFAYIPFSAGPRNCIGQKFAMLEMKSTISKICRNFELYPSNPVHKMHLVSETILKSDNGVKIGIRARN